MLCRTEITVLFNFLIFYINNTELDIFFLQQLGFSGLLDDDIGTGPTFLARATRLENMRRAKEK